MNNCASRNTFEKRLIRRAFMLNISKSIPVFRVGYVMYVASHAMQVRKPWYVLNLL